MDCNESRRLLEADTDGELDLVHHLALAEHLRTCPECSRHAEILRARRHALRESLPRFTAPPALAEKIRAALRAEAAPVPSTTLTPPVAAARRALWPRWPIGNFAALAASLVIALGVGYAWGHGRARTHLLFDEAFSDHLRSLQASHLTDVTSTDQHTVKPWFAGRLDFSPPVVDLAPVGFPLAGGRLEQLAGHPTAALVFHRRQHVINVFIWPADVAKIPLRQEERDGYHAETWTAQGFNFLAVSDIPAEELAQFAKAYRTPPH